MSTPVFDVAAETYDREFTDRQPGRWFRDTVWAVAKRQFKGANRVLDVGCGTGEDAVFLADLGKVVCAVDISPAMIDAARIKAASHGVEDQITFFREDLEDLRLEGEEPFDGLISDFGPLNCVEDPQIAARVFSRWVRPGGVAILVVMGPWCPWEMAWYGLHGRPGQALRRFKRGLEAPVRGGPESVAVWYHAPATVSRAFGAGFEPVQLVGIGTLLPPPYLNGLVDRMPRLFSAVASIEQRVQRFFPFNRLCDHYALVLRRKA